jgi:hypothetical protein
MRPKMRFVAISGPLQPEKIKGQLKTDGVVLLPKPFTTEKPVETLHQVLEEANEVKQANLPSAPADLRTPTDKIAA